ncbi:MAG: macrolide ABC transporter ATP-binding protein [Candidatus Hydrogenedentes bacterium CG07_land_8_20_14_0_80_42_17]|nr:MAG: macrolide ABC transporter ATP-binding protein [Candidatus Hydrogenedentes bacterium CG07_land_8_20_14_0_80_42_17]
MIELRDIHRTFKMGDDLVHALTGVSLKILRGDYVSIMGPSGSGKSTLLNLLGCLDRSDSGIYLFEGRDVSSLSDTELSSLRQNRIGFVFQFFHLISRLTAAENIELPMIFAGIDRKERRDRIMEGLNSVGLAHRAKHRPEQLSGGERQKIAIARAIAMRPSILLADEPTGNLDSKSGREIIDLLESMNQNGLTLVIVTHDSLIGSRATRKVKISDGKIVSIL